MDLGLRLACKPQAQQHRPYAFSEYGSFQEEDIRIGSKGLTVVEQGQDDVSYSGICLDDLEFSSETLGAGSSGVVKQAIHLPTGTLLAVKVMSLSLEEGDRRKALQELRTLHKCNHPNIVEFKGAFYRDGSISILLEFMDVGALDCLLQVNPTMPEEVVGQLAAGLVSAMAYIHKELHIVHRDIKPSNVLVNSAGQVKLSDFGVSSKLANTIGQATTFAGTVTFMSPERIKGDAHSTTSDVWSLGVTLLQCALGRFPYFDEQEEAGRGIAFFDLLERIQNRPAPVPPPSFSEDCRSFIAECLRKDPLKRPSAVDLLEHPFVIKHSSGSEALTAWIYETMRMAGRSNCDRITPPRPVPVAESPKPKSCPPERRLRSSRSQPDGCNRKSYSTGDHESDDPRERESRRAHSDQTIRRRVRSKSSSSKKKSSKKKGRDREKERDKEKEKDSNREKEKDREKRDSREKDREKDKEKDKEKERKERKERRDKRTPEHESGDSKEARSSKKEARKSGEKGKEKTKAEKTRRADEKEREREEKKKNKKRKKKAMTTL